MRALAILAILAAIAVSGCGGDSDAIGDGRHFGYIDSVDMASTPATIEFDAAEFLTGDEAAAAAVEDGVLPEGEPVPNDYYIRNDDESLETLTAGSEVAVTHIQCPDSCTEGVPGDFQDFAASFEDMSEKTLADEYRGADSQYWVTVRDGEVVAIDEQYLP